MNTFTLPRKAKHFLLLLIFIFCVEINFCIVMIIILSAFPNQYF